MAYVHVAHDCKVGNNTIMANAATLGGHVLVEDYAFIGGLIAVHQYTRIGRYAMVGGSAVSSRISRLIWSPQGRGQNSTALTPSVLKGTAFQSPR